MKKVSILTVAIFALFITTQNVFGQTISAEIESVSAQHNVNNDGKVGMQIHIKFSVNNMLNKTGRCVAYFYFENGDSLIDYNGSYNTTSGEVSVGKNFTPNYENSVYDDFILFMPYSELHIASGKFDLYFFVDIFDNNNKSITRSDRVGFSYESNAQKPNNTAKKGLGVVEFDAEYITYRNETRSYYHYGSGGATVNSDGTSSYSPGKSSTETVTTRVPVEADYELPFQVLKGDSVIYDGYTPVRVTNFTPGETYTIIWIGTNGKRKTGSFTVPSDSPYTKYLHLE